MRRLTTVNNCIFWLFLACGLCSQKTIDSIKSGYSIGDDVSLSAKNALSLVTAPATFTWREWLITSAVVGGTLITFSIDNKVYQYSKSHKSLQADKLIGPWHLYGSPAVLSVGGILYGAGLIFSRPSLRETGREALTAMITTQAITLTLKIIFGRAPPGNESSPKNFKFFQFDQNNWSFPSGHTALAFSLSCVLSERIKNPFVSIALYGAASMVALERVYNNRHWLSDVIMGAVIGTAAGKIVVSSSKNVETENLPVVVHPDVSTRAIGIKVIYTITATAR